MGRHILIEAVLVYARDNWIQLLGAVLGLFQIWLLVRRSVWNFPVAMVMVTLFAVTYVEEQLYAEAGLQLFFFVVNAVGWFQWRGLEDQAHQVPVRWMTWPSRGTWAAITITLSLMLGWLLDTFTSAAMAFADSAIAGASIAAQLLLNARRIENWVLWVVIDLAAIALYVNRELYFFAALYLAFLVISLIGLREWMTAEKGDRAA